MNTVKFIALSALSLALFACGDEAPTAQHAGRPTDLAEAYRVHLVGAQTNEAAPIPAEAVADFEDEADSQIDSANYETELSSLEKELAEDK